MDFSDPKVSYSDQGNVQTATVIFSAKQMPRNTVSINLTYDPVDGETVDAKRARTLAAAKDALAAALASL